MVGGSVVIENRFAFPQVVLETMKDTSVTGLAGVPSTFVILLDQSDLADRRFESLRYVTQAGGHMPVSVQRRLAAAIAPAKLYIMYGTTEAAPRLTFLEPQDLDRKAGSVGKAVPNVEIAVVDDQDRPVEPGQTGQVIARGSNIMVGYWRDPEETAKALRNGWYHTGDMGWMDDEGYLYLVGRSQDIVKVGGQRVSILEVEDALMQVPGIHQAAVIPVEDHTLGQALEAFVVPAKDIFLQEETIRRQLSQSLPRFKSPRCIHICEALPMDPSGKVIKSRLQAHPKA
jgi:acyl-CoA synthetase (AMP-forming)/AMP-acid ligase II